MPNASGSNWQSDLESKRKEAWGPQWSSLGTTGRPVFTADSHLQTGCAESGGGTGSAARAAGELEGTRPVPGDGKLWGTRELPHWFL